MLTLSKPLAATCEMDDDDSFITVRNTRKNRTYPKPRRQRTTNNPNYTGTSRPRPPARHLQSNPGRPPLRSQPPPSHRNYNTEHYSKSNTSWAHPELSQSFSRQQRRRRSSSYKQQYRPNSHWHYADSSTAFTRPSTSWKLGRQSNYRENERANNADSSWHDSDSTSAEQKSFTNSTYRKPPLTVNQIPTTRSKEGEKRDFQAWSAQRLNSAQQSKSRRLTDALKTKQEAQQRRRKEQEQTDRFNPNAPLTYDVIDSFRGYDDWADSVDDDW